MSSFADVTAFLPRATVRDGRALEQALAGQTLFQPGVELAGAVVEATFAATEPPLMKRLVDRRVPYLIDPHSLRFTSDGYLSIPQLAALEHAPNLPLTPELDGEAIRDYARASLLVEARFGAADFLTPGVPIHDDRWLELNHRIVAAAVQVNGTGAIDRKPLLALVAPGRRALLDPHSVIEPMRDAAIDGVYVQPLRLSPTRDSVDKLVAYVRFLDAARSLGLPVIAGRVGAFGLVLEAFASACSTRASGRQRDSISPH